MVSGCRRPAVHALLPRRPCLQLCTCAVRAPRSTEQAVATLQSPQFRHALDVFSTALVSGRLDLRHFGLEPKGFSVVDFLESIQAAADKARASGGGSGC